MRPSAPNTALRAAAYTTAVLLLLGATPSRQSRTAAPGISKRINAFAIDLLKQCAGAESAPPNTILSPQSVFHGLAMGYVASGGRTRQQLARALHFPQDDARLLADLTSLRQQLVAAAKHRRIDLSMANGAWLDDTYARFQDGYRKQVQDAFGAVLHGVRFRDGERVSSEINAWVSEKTRERISQVVTARDFRSKSSPGTIEEAALAIVSAVYLKADWGSRFERRATRDLPFYLSPSEQTKTPMMHQLSLLRYASNETFQFLELPYIGNTYSMIVLLPKKALPVRDLMELTTTDVVSELSDNALVCDVDVLFPKFEIRSHVDIRGTLAAMGVHDAFDRRRGDFRRMIHSTPQASRVYISAACHDAWIEVHEKGTEAAAATTIVHYSVGCSAAPMRPPPVQFHADHPFVYMVVHSQSRSVLFAGWVSDPRETAGQTAVADS